MGKTGTKATRGDAQTQFRSCRMGEGGERKNPDDTRSSRRTDKVSLAWSIPFALSQGKTEQSVLIN
jgi:hypothetical protein